MYKYNDIKIIHLEITQRCQAACPMCGRNENGGKENKHLTNAELSLNDCKQIFTSEFISQLNIMYMGGNFGDPIIATDTLEVFKYFREHNKNMWLSMHTNGGARTPMWWENLAQLLGEKGSVTFSIDGLEDTNHLYRQNVNWKIVIKNIEAFIKAGGKAEWHFIVFKHNEHQIEQAKLFSKQLGIDKFVIKKTGRFISDKLEKKENYQVISNDDRISVLSLPSKNYQNNTLHIIEPLIKKYGSVDAYYDATKISCKVENDYNLFITAEGLALPCAWTAARMYKWDNEDPTSEQIWDFINMVGGKDAINAKNGLDKVFKSGIFDAIKDSWSKLSCNDGKLRICSKKCGKEFDAFSNQFI